MKKLLYIIGMLLPFTFIGCHAEEEETILEIPSSNTSSNIPADHFVVTFTSLSRAAISGPDTRVQSLLYVLYKSSGEFVKERVILIPGGSQYNK